AKGTTQQFTAMGTYSDSSTQNITSLVTWSSSNTATATISNATGSNGLATGESAGATTITAALDGVLGTTDISVTSATLVSIEVTPANSQIAKGTTQQFTAIGTFSDASTQDLTSSVSWSSSSIATATISNVSGSNGFATGVASGTTTITAALSGVTGSTSLAVTNATLVSIAVSPTNPSIAKGTTQQFTAMGTYSDSSTQNITSLVTWSSSNTATATISNAPGSNGLATGNAASTTTITATLEGVLGTTSLSVTDATLVSIAVTPISSQIAKGLTQQFTAIGTFSDASTQDLTSSVTWSSSSITTATISNVLGSNGLATGEASGTTTITATLGSVSGTASLAVTNATLVSIAVTPTNPSIAKGTTQQFTAMGTYSDSSTHNITSAVTWTSSSTATATISNAPESNGLATGESFGTTTITATLGGISGTASLAVTNATLVSIAVTPISSQIAKGITQQFTAIGTYSDSSIQDLTSSVTWSSSSIATATISNESGSNGLATGVSSGTTTIAATLDSVSGTASLAVTNATLVSIAVTPTDPSIAKGTTQQFTAIGTFSDSSTHDLTSSVTWSSSNTAIATISNTSGSNGIATGVASGTTTITATLSSVSGTSNLAVTNATLVSIAITPPNSQIAKGLTQQFTATGTYSDSSTQDLTSSVTWSSSITNIATISNAPQTNGLATGNSPGTTTITASLGSVSTTTSLTVTNATLVSIAVTPTNPSIAEGTTQQLTAMGTFSDSNVYNVTSSVIWSSSDTTIATVSNAPESNGQATGLSSGTATITATLGSVSGTTNLAVTNATLVSIAVTPTNQQIAKGTTQQFTAIGTYSDASTQDLTDTVTWSSSSIATATISNATGSNGLATGVSSGTTTVTAALGSVSGTASLAVTNATLVSIAVTPTNSSIAEGTSQQFTAIGTYSDSSTQNLTSSVTWASSNTATATISNAAGSNGLANGESAGATTITATLDSVSGTASLTVTNATLVSIAITPVNASIATGLTQQFTAVGTYSDSSTQDLTNSVIWSSSNTGSATISNAPGSNGRATGVSSGSTTITATLDSVSGAASLVVTNATLVSIAVTPTNPSIAKGTTQQFTAIGTFSDSSTHDLTSSVIWTSSNTAIATISNASGSNGLAAGASSGSTIITATLGSVSDTANLEVTNATLVSIAVTPPNPQIADGFTQQFTAIGTYSDSSTQDLTSTVTWSSSSTAIATVSNASGSNGQATGVSSGTATITAVLGSVSGTANLAVTNATLVSIAVTPTNPSIAKGTTQQFTATGTFSDSSTLNLTSSVTWSSSNTSTATISNAAGSNGIATGVASGTTAITAALGSVSGTTNLAVTNATLVSIEITPPNPQIAKGSTQQFTATGTYSDSSTQNLTSSVTWTSSDTAIATISNVSGSNGQATGASSGTTTITATSGSVSGSASLAVTNATLVSITVSPTNPSIAKGTTQQFTATGTYSDSSTQNLSSSVTWSSSSTAIATISNAAGSNGLATGVSSGSSVITATLGSVSGTGSITVTDATLVLITVTPSNPQIAAGLTQQFTATGTYSDFSTQILTTSVTWTSSSTATATISNASGSKGLATGASSGTTAITATLGSVSGTANLAVTNATLVSIAVMPADAQIAQGSTQQFIATGTFTDSSTLDITSSVTWSSSDTVTATISNASGSKGLATGESSGITTITATAGGSISGTTSLTVSSRISIAVGYYHDTSSVTRPLLAQSQDLGDNWIYPESITAPIFTPNNTYPYASDGLLQSANCSGALCIAGGIYIDSSGNSRPLLAQSSDLGSTWQFPESITAPVFEPNNTYPYSFLGSFIGTSCFGTSCIAAGSYTDINFINRPLLAQSQDSGVTWTYPESITAPDFKPNNTYPFNNNGSFANTSCNNNTCIAVGHYYSDASTRRALLAQSQNSGVTWTYPSSVTAPVFTPNTYPYSADGIFYSVSCTSTNSGSNYCVAVGLYSDASAVSRPLLAVSQDSGVTWTFPGSITAPFFTPSNTYPFQGDGVLFGVSCDGSICVAVGRYTDTNNIKRPLLAQSTDAGVTWTYPTSVTAPVFTPSNTYPFGNPTGSQITFLTSASCHGSICIAVGSYTDSNTIIRPLLVQSTNSGATWTYPESITAPSFPSAYAFSNFGSLIRARCDGNICIAAGIYTTGDPTRRPLLAQSTDSGVTWTYPESIPVPVFTPTNTYPFAEQGTLSGAGSNNSWAPESLSFLLD
ncbi:Ig-like domain-containing protein, partial [Legionella gratiana]